MEKKACSFTGHRKIKDGHRSKISALVARSIAYAYSHGCRTFYTGGAVGFDTVAAREVLRFRISNPDVRLVLLLPCTDQDKYWTAAQRSSYEYVLSAADEVVYVSEEYTDTCIKERNMHLAERADILIAYLGHARSGSAQTVRMAENLGKEVYNLYPTLEKED
ncbi:MAG: DUF1273 family protein [Clostridia bacterium]|nr:DUF1273 family protein [Clostridia bacterium]